MNTITSREMRSLTAEELDAVTGGMTASFHYGSFQMDIYATGTFYSVAASNGTSVYEINQY